MQILSKKTRFLQVTQSKHIAKMQIKEKWDKIYPF